MIFATIIMVAIVFASANAQVLVNGVNMDNKSVYEHLKNNQKDTVLMSINSFRNGTDSIVVAKKAILLGENRVGMVSDTTIYRTVVTQSVNAEKMDELFAASVSSRYTEMGKSALTRRDSSTMTYHVNHLYQRDTYYALVEGMKGVSKDDVDAGKIALYSVDKYGWSVGAYLGYQKGMDQASPFVGINLNLSRQWWQAGFNLEGGECFYVNDDTNLVDSYTSYRSELYGAIRPIQLDAYDCNRLFIVGGVGFETYKTDNEMDYESNPDGTSGNKTAYNEWGNSIYPTAGLRYEHRFFATGNSVYTTLMWRGCEGVFKNSDDRRYHSVGISVGFTFGANRNKLDLVGGRKAIMSKIK